MTPGRPRRLVHAGVLVVLGALSLVYLGVTVRNVPARIASPIPLSLVEPNLVLAALRVAAGEPLYRDYRVERPMVPLQYGALEYCVPGWVARAAAAPGAQMQLGRGTSLVCGIGVWLALAWLAAERGVPRLRALAAAAPLLWFPYAFEWFTKSTPDPAALLLSLAGWAALGPPGAVAWPRRRLVTGVLLWVLAFHFKPSVLVGPIGFGVEHVAAAWRRRDRGLLGRPAVAAVCLAAATLVSVAVLDARTAGLWRLNAIGAVGVAQFDATLAAQSLRNFGPAMLLQTWLGPEVPLVLGGVGILVAMAGIAALWARSEPLFAAFLVNLGLEVAALAKEGSNVNYLLGSLALWGLAATVAFLVPGRAPLAGRRGMATLALLGAVAVLLALDVPRAATFAFEVIVPPPGEFERVETIVRAAPDGSVLNLDTNFGLVAGVPAPFTDGFHAALLARAGIADFAPEVAALEAGRYQLVITNRYQAIGGRYHDVPFMPEILGRVLMDRYAVIGAGSWLVLWSPKPVAP